MRYFRQKPFKNLRNGLKNKKEEAYGFY